jgi:predicted membrane chloride channel (bestrophin family)
MIEYEEEWLLPLLFRGEGSVALRASLFAVPSAIIAVLVVYMDEWDPGLHEELGFTSEISGSHIWNSATGVCLILLAFRTKTAFRRFWEGTGLLHQMRGEWFDTVSNCVTFSIAAKPSKPAMVNSFRHSLVRLMSLCHGSALEEIAENSIRLEVIDIAGLDFGTLSHLQECDQKYGFNKVEVMLHLVQSLITKALDDGVIKIPPPIASRVYQTISRGFVNLLNAKKITDTKFPFPYAQLISGLLFLDTVLTPIMIGQAVRSKVLAAIFTFIPIFGMYSLNFIASELENPFGTDENDLPLTVFQDEMNSCLLMLLHPNTDMMAGVSDRCITGFVQLMEAMKLHPESEGSAALRLSDFTFDQEHGFTRAATPENSEAFRPSIPPAKVPPASSPVVEPSVPTPPANDPGVPPPPVSPEERRRLQEQEAIRLEAAQRDVEQRIGEFLSALQRWTRMVQGQVKQIHEILDVLRLLSEAASKPGSGGWEQAIPHI